MGPMTRVGTLLLALALAVGIAPSAHAGTSKGSDPVEPALGNPDIVGATFTTTKGRATATITFAQVPDFTTNEGLGVAMILEFPGSTWVRTLEVAELAGSQVSFAQVCDYKRSTFKGRRCSGIDHSLDGATLTMSVPTKRIFPKGVRAARVKKLRWSAQANDFMPGRSCTGQPLCADKIGSKAIQHKI